MLISHSRTNTGKKQGNVDENMTFLLISCHSSSTDEHSGRGLFHTERSRKVIENISDYANALK